MFLLNSLQPKKLCQYIARSVFILAILFCLSLSFLFTGCETGDGGGYLGGTWNDGFGYRVINTSAMTIEFENVYKGKIANSPNFRAENGFLIIEFTEYFDEDFSSWPDITYTPNPANIGKFGALYWRDLTSNSVRFADHWKEVTTSNWEHVMYSDIGEATANFTMGIINDIDWGAISPHTK